MNDALALVVVVFMVEEEDIDFLVEKDKVGIRMEHVDLDAVVGCV